MTTALAPAQSPAARVGLTREASRSASRVGHERGALRALVSSLVFFIRAFPMLPIFRQAMA